MTIPATRRPDVFRVVLFDIDGTLVGRDEVFVRAHAAAFAEIFDLPDASIFDVPLHGRTERAIVQMVVTHHGVPPTEAAALVDQALAAKDHAFARILADEPGRNPVSALAGGLRLLRSLTTAGVLCGLVTGNTAFSGLLKLERAGYRLSDFQACGWGDAVLDRTDVVAAAIAAARRFIPDLRASEILVVGDTPGDVAAAQVHGCASLAIATGAFPSDVLSASTPSRTARDLVEATPWILARARRKPCRCG